MDETVGGQTTAELSKRFYAAMQGRSLKLKDDQGNLCSLSLHKCNDWGNESGLANRTDFTYYTLRLTDQNNETYQVVLR